MFETTYWQNVPDWWVIHPDHIEKKVGQWQKDHSTYATDDETKIGPVMDNAVDPVFGGKGIGSAMHRKVLKAMQTASMKIAKVGAGIDENQAPARRLYEKHGFKEVYVEKFYLRRLKDLKF